MKTKFKSLVLLLVTTFAAISCSTDRTREEKVAAVINDINAPFLVINTSPDGLIKKSGALDGALPFTYEILFSFFIDEEVTGVDYETDVQIIVAKGPSFAPHFYGVFKLKNEKAFIELLETEANAKVEEKEGFKYVIKEADQFVVVWNDDMVIASNIPIDMQAMFNGGGGDQGMKAVNKNISLIKASEEKEGTDEYLTFLKNDADIAMHFSGKGFYSYLKEMSMGDTEELEKNKETFEGTTLDIAINFNDGNMSIDLNAEYSEELKDKIAFLNEAGAPKGLMKYGNTKNPIMSMSYNFDVTRGMDYTEEQMNPEDFENFIKMLSEIGLTKEEAKKALGGNLVFMLDRVDIEEEVVDYGYGDPYVSKNPKPVFAVVLSVKDMSIVKKALAESAKKEMGELTEEEATLMAAEMFNTDGVVALGDAYLVFKEDALFSSNDSLWAAKAFASKTVEIDNKGGVISDYPVGVYGDFTALSKMDELGEARVLVDLMEDFMLKGDMEKMNLTFNFTDKSQNVLRTLTETIANMANDGEQVGQDELEAESRSCCYRGRKERSNFGRRRELEKIKM